MSVRVGARVAPSTGVRKLRRPVSTAAAPSFNPLTSWTTPPLHGVWASDPLWTPPADGGAVSSWRNGGSVGGDLVQATGAAQPTYDASNPAYNNQPVVTFATDDVLAVDVADVAQPHHLMVVGHANGGDAVADMFIGLGGGTARGVFLHDSLNGWTLHAGTGITGGTEDADPHLLRGIANGASSSLLVDETTVASGNASTNAVTILSLGAGNSAIGTYQYYLNGSIALALVFNTNPTALPEWASFVTWVETTYGLTIA